MNNIENIFQEKADYYDNILGIFNDYRIAVYHTNLTTLRYFCDFAIFTLLGSYDLWISLCDYQKSIKKYQQKYYARQISLLVFELLSDIPQRFSKFIILFDKIDNDSLQKSALEVRKKFNKIRNDNEKEFKDIRNLTIAHREHNITEQINIINKIDSEVIIEFGLSYLKEIEILHDLMNNILQYLQHDINSLNADEFFKKYRFDIDLTNSE